MFPNFSLIIQKISDKWTEPDFLWFVYAIQRYKRKIDNYLIYLVYRQGDEALNWYAVIYGSLDVQVSHTGKRKVRLFQ